MSNFEKNGEACAVALSSKGITASRVGVCWSDYSSEGTGVGACEGNEGGSLVVHNESRLGRDHRGNSLRWRSAGNSPQRSGYFRKFDPGAINNVGSISNNSGYNMPKISARGRRLSVYVPPPLANGWQWRSRNDERSYTVLLEKEEGSGGFNGNGNGENHDIEKDMTQLSPSGEQCQIEVEYESTEDEEEILNLDSDQDVASTEGTDSEDSDVSYETLKTNKWFKGFFYLLDKLTIEQIDDPERQWHCPACKGGVGAIDWFWGIQPVLTHAKTMKSRRVKLHRQLAEVLEAEIRRRGVTSLIFEEMFGKWRGLQQKVNDQLIVWPPIVIIQNTMLHQDENEQWVGMGNKELLEYFKEYKAMRARHAYGPKGHRGISALAFEESVMGYLEAERLHKHFLKEGRGKDDWKRCSILFYPGGNRILYGYLATKEEMDNFNRHSKGKVRLKFEMKSYEQMVVEPMKKMDEDSQKLIYLKIKVAKEQEHSKNLEETVSLVASKLRMKESEIKIIKDRATEQHEEHNKEMDYLEQNFKQQIEQLSHDTANREKELAKMEQELKTSHLDHCHQLQLDSAMHANEKSMVDDKPKEEQIKIDEEITMHTRVIETSFRDSEEHEYKQHELIKAHDKKWKEIKLGQLQEELKFKKNIERERIELLQKYAKKIEEADINSG